MNRNRAKPNRDEQLEAKRLTMTLEQLEGSAWPNPNRETGLIREAHRVRKTPLGQLTVEDLRIAIGQGVGLQFLVPLALDVLEREPFAEGDFYPGDLLVAVAKSLEQPFWRSQSVFVQRLRSIASRAFDLLPQVPISPKLAEELRESIRRLREP